MILYYVQIKLNNFIEIYDDIIPKEGWDYIINQFDNREFPEEFVGGDTKFKKSYTVGMNFDDDYFSTFNEPIAFCLRIALEQYKQKYPFMNKLIYWACDKGYNLQRYQEGEGYHFLHCEQDGNPAYHSRMLVWMLYLNDAECGTEFPYQDIVIQPKSGRLLIWPAAWTHPHRGVVPNKGLKYIATGWYRYEKELC